MRADAGAVSAVTWNETVVEPAGTGTVAGTENALGFDDFTTSVAAVAVGRPNVTVSVPLPPFAKDCDEGAMLTSCEKIVHFAERKFGRTPEAPRASVNSLSGPEAVLLRIVTSIVFAVCP